MSAKGPQPPLHPNCRCTLVPKVSGIGLIGERPVVGGHNFLSEAKGDYLKSWKAKGVDDKAARGKWNNLSSKYKNRLMLEKRRAFGDSVVGSASANYKGSDFVKNMSSKAKVEILGKERARFFLRIRVS